MEVFNMAQFPHKVGDIIKDQKGIPVAEVKAVIKGTVDDTYDGHIISEFIVDKKGVKVPVGEPFIRYFRDRLNDKLEEGEMILGIRPNPAAQCVHYQLIETGRVFNVKPNRFLELVGEWTGVKQPVLPIAAEVEPELSEDEGGENTYAEWGFSVEDAQFIQDNYLTMSDKELAEALSTDTHKVLAARVKTFRIEGLGLNKRPGFDKAQKD